MITRLDQINLLQQVVRERRDSCRKTCRKGGDVLQTIPAKWVVQSMSAFEKIIKEQDRENGPLLHDDPILRPIAVAMGFSLPNRTKE